MPVFIEVTAAFGCKTSVTAAFSCVGRSGAREMQRVVRRRATRNAWLEFRGRRCETVALRRQKAAIALALRAVLEAKTPSAPAV
jgi:Flp pilus assembly protein CpaB